MSCWEIVTDNIRITHTLFEVRMCLWHGVECEKSLVSRHSETSTAVEEKSCFSFWLYYYLMFIPILTLSLALVSFLKSFLHEKWPQSDFWSLHVALSWCELDCKFIMTRFGLVCTNVFTLILMFTSLKLNKVFRCHWVSVQCRSPFFSVFFCTSIQIFLQYVGSQMGQLAVFYLQVSEELHLFAFTLKECI